MGVLLDTNVISELRKGHRAHPNVIAWAERVKREPQHISVLTLGEIRQGIEQIRRKDERQAEALESWLIDVELKYNEALLPICERVAEEWGRLNALRSRPVIDGLLSATARVHGLRIATRNIRDFENAGIAVENPFEDPQPGA
ncbi:MAG: type II toxin-antitoxin system VapC family toxin [Kiritimatiellia bacterium]